MISLEDIQYETRDDSISQKLLDERVTRAKNFLMGYCRNPKMFDEDDPALAEVVFYMVSASFNEDVRGRQGLVSESVGGASFTYINDLPNHLKRSLRNYKRARLI